MKEIKQGTLYGFDLVLKVPEEFIDDNINENTLEKYVKYIEKLAREEQS